MTAATLTLTERTAPECGCSTAGAIIRGMCRKHYDRWVHRTPPEERGIAPRFARDFWDNVDKAGDCWLWIGSTNAGGYGIWSDKRNSGEAGLAHRISLARVTPPDSPDLLACHTCDVRACVRPDHLYWGTHEDNARDVAERGGPWNKGLKRDACMRGHALVGENLKITGKDKRRRCRICENARAREKMRRLAAARKEARNAAT